MGVIENADTSGLPYDSRERLKEIVKYFHAFQLNRKKPVQFLFSVRDLIIAEIRNNLQAGIVKLSDG